MDPSGPVVHKALLVPAVESMRNGLIEAEERRAKLAAMERERELYEVLRHAYVAGLRDGFVQGVAAASESEEAVQQ